MEEMERRNVEEGRGERGRRLDNNKNGQQTTIPEGKNNDKKINNNNNYNYKNKNKNNSNNNNNKKKKNSRSLYSYIQGLKKRVETLAFFLLNSNLPPSPSPSPSPSLSLSLSQVEELFTSM